MRIAIACVLVAATTAAASAKDDPKAAIGALARKQVGSLAAAIDDSELPAGIYTDDATFSATGQYDVGACAPAQLGDAVLGMCGLHSDDVTGLRVQLAADGQSAVVSFAVHFELKCDVSGEYFDRDERASEIAVKTKNGWRIAGGAWSDPVANADADAAAAKGKLPALAAVADADGDASVRAAVDALVAKGVDDAAAARKELIAIGSGPRELTTTGAALAKPWKAAWVGHTTIDGKVRAQVAPGGGAAWAIANVTSTRTKGKATTKIPFRVLLAFVKAGDAWSLVHAHFAVRPP
jgi:hypothetical protein